MSNEVDALRRMGERSSARSQGEIERFVAKAKSDAARDAISSLSDTELKIMIGSTAPFMRITCRRELRKRILAQFLNDGFYAVS